MARDPNVHLCNPSWQRTSVAFDIDLADTTLGTPTPAFVTQALRALGVPSDPVDWTVEAFCSPWFSVHRDHFRARNPRAWRMEVRLASEFVLRDRDKPFRKQVGLIVEDGTVVYAPETWDALPAVVIGDFTLGNWRPLEAMLGTEPFAGVRVERIAAHWLYDQGRFHLGEVRFPDEEPRIQRLVVAISDLAATRWDQDIVRSVAARRPQP